MAGAWSGGWRAFPQAHRLAAVVLAVFMLPLLLDALHGGGSNLARILSRLQTDHDPPKRFARSLCYLLTFGAYGPYQSGTQEFAHYGAAGMLAFVRLHWRVYTLWALALAGTPALFLAARRWRTAEATALRPGPPLDGGFLRRFGGMTGAAPGLTLVWGMRQQGQMFYFNAFFNYSAASWRPCPCRFTGRRSRRCACRSARRSGRPPWRGARGRCNSFPRRALAREPGSGHGRAAAGRGFGSIEFRLAGVPAVAQ